MVSSSCLCVPNTDTGKPNSALVLPVAALALSPSATTISHPVLSAHISNWSLAAALNVSPAAINTYDNSSQDCWWTYWYSILPILAKFLIFTYLSNHFLISHPTLNKRTKRVYIDIKHEESTLVPSFLNLWASFPEKTNKKPILTHYIFLQLPPKSKQLYTVNVYCLTKRCGLPTSIHANDHYNSWFPDTP